MPINVKADVVDIRTDSPLPEDKFLVDTNAWYWLFYPKATQQILQAQNYQTSEYPAYLKSAISAGSSLLCTPLNFSELAHNIERSEREIYAYNANRTIQSKEFRHGYPMQRKKCIDLIKDIWEDVTSISSVLPLDLHQAFLDSSIARFDAIALDGYDLFTVEQMLSQGITNVITDDGDFCTVPGITVFTANRTAIRDATAAKKLVAR
ncbi:PIN domain-containing protein [Metapseudomonas boanensis]|uniref:PIN domain-containing protein n=1 Tax=Metapseudomonas boanensis TaxID=2822138 RepID=A0ABS5XIR6_9GAMM|nr:PIN domain-containing protein [Pseudomonas boanensis]MBT8767564.1 PIN domain-containing protein [Pseudomonas boanensis]